MDPREFVETRTKRYMAQALEELEVKIEQPLRQLAETNSDAAAIAAEIDGVKRTFRKRLQSLASDCIDLMPSGLEINALELVRR